MLIVKYIGIKDCLPWAVRDAIWNAELAGFGNIVLGLHGDVDAHTKEALLRVSGRLEVL